MQKQKASDNDDILENNNHLICDKMAGNCTVLAARYEEDEKPVLGPGIIVMIFADKEKNPWIKDTALLVLIQDHVSDFLIIL